MQAQQLTLVWETEVIRKGENRVEMVAKRPLSHMSTKQAAKVLGVSVWTVQNLYQMHLLEGYKPGARVLRKDGRRSNAALRLDSESVLRYKAARQAMER